MHMVYDHWMFIRIPVNSCEASKCGVCFGSCGGGVLCTIFSAASSWLGTPYISKAVFAAAYNSRYRTHTDLCMSMAIGMSVRAATGYHVRDIFCIM